MTFKSAIGRSGASLVVSFYRLASYVVLSPAMLTIAWILLMPANDYAAIINRLSCQRFDHVAEVQFQLRGTAPRWHLYTHGQELWLDLEQSHLNTSIGGTPVSVVFPLTRLTLRDFGDGEVRMVFRVRGQVDYVVAEMPHVLIVRIAPAGEAGDLAKSLLLRHEIVGNPAYHRTAVNIKSDDPLAPPAARTAARPATAGLSISEPAGERSPDTVTEGSLSGGSESSHAATTPAQTVEPVAERVGPAPSITPNERRPMVVIDAGHGGFDPGTESAGGIQEKAIALEIAERLAKALESRGVTAELTRDDDRFLPLSERTELANQAHADLFISIHLNSSPDWNTSGLETYYLNNTSDRATIRLAQMENGGSYSGLSQSNLSYILANLRQDYKAHESSSLARLIETDIAATVDSALGVRVNELGAKMGPFYVLVGAEMPAVLVECGFLSNARETQLLVQPAYQVALAQGVAAAIFEYFNASAAVGNL